MRHSKVNLIIICDFRKGTWKFFKYSKEILEEINEKDKGGMQFPRSMDMAMQLRLFSNNLIRSMQVLWPRSIGKQCEELTRV